MFKIKNEIFAHGEKKKIYKLLYKEWNGKFTVGKISTVEHHGNL